ncbi:MAG: phosphatase PAP2 family protein [Clostridia bacterium]|nr:phosphatase PAP2 family protein [Clostridia bacterium]
MKKWGKISIAAALGVLFLALIAIVKWVDVAAIGPEGTSVGLSHLNGAVASALGFQETWYKITKLTGYVAFAVIAAFAVLGGWQLISRKSLAKVDRKLLFLAGLYVVTAVLYVVFEKVVINYRPVIVPGDAGPEASFPSTHTMLAVVVFGSALLLLPDYLADRRLLLGARCVVCALLLVTVIGRLLSGVHWLTDILGGILLGAFLLAAFRLFTEQMHPNKLKR